jgi:hypothetical protein
MHTSSVSNFVIDFLQCETEGTDFIEAAIRHERDDILCETDYGRNLVALERRLV